MGNKYRTRPLRIVGLPEELQRDKEYMANLKRMIRVAACLCCDQVRRNTTIGCGKMKWVDPNDLPDEEDFMTSSEQDAEVVFGMCEDCFTNVGIDKAVEMLAEKRAAYSPSVHKEVSDQAKKTQREMN